MNTRHAGASVPVWDRFVRVFHWSVVTAYFGAYLTNDAGRIHHAFGYAVLALVAARIAWGFAGTRHARFANFVPTPRGFVDYARAMLRGREPRHVGHNPAGGAMIVVMLALLASTAVSGWLLTTDAFWGSEAVEDFHAFGANALLACVALHVAGVVLASWRHRENLVRAMLTGRKRAE